MTAYTADISPDAKLKINGREVEYTRIGDESDTQSFWVETDLTMTPTTAEKMALGQRIVMERLPSVQMEILVNLQV